MVKIGYRGGIALVTASSAAVPVVGILTAPLLARGLGVSGRGELSAVTAPALILLVVVSLGLPNAAAYFAARSATRVGWVVLVANVITLPLGVAGILAVWSLSPVLAAGDASTGRLMVLAACFVPAQLVVGVVRGAAIGRQEWTLVAAERVASTVVKLVLIAGFLLAGRLDVLTAVVITVVSPVLAAFVYLGFAFKAMRRRGVPGPDDQGHPPASWRDVLRFGLGDWWGALALELFARVPQIVVAPAAGFEELGLFVVGVTISDVPRLVTTAVRDVVFGANAAERNDDRLQATSRSLIVFSALVTIVLGSTLWIWMVPVFGEGFSGATLPAVVLLVSSVIAVPNQMAATALRSAGHPGLASWSVIASLMVSASLIWPASSLAGALGASCVSVATALTGTVVSLWLAKVHLGLRPAGFFAIGRGDIAAGFAMFKEITARLSRRIRH